MNRSLSENLFHQRAVEVVVSVFSLRRWSQFHANISELLLQSNCWFPASCLNILKCTSDCRLSRTPEIARVTHILCQMSISFDKQSKLFSSKENQITYWIKKKNKSQSYKHPTLFISVSIVIQSNNLIVTSDVISLQDWNTLCERQLAEASSLLVFEHEGGGCLQINEMEMLKYTIQVPGISI